MLLENCLHPGKPIGLPITLEWIGPAQTGRGGGAGKRAGGVLPQFAQLFSLFFLSIITFSRDRINDASAVTDGLCLTFTLPSEEL